MVIVVLSTYDVDALIFLLELVTLVVKERDHAFFQMTGHSSRHLKGVQRVEEVDRCSMPASGSVCAGDKGMRL